MARAAQKIRVVDYVKRRDGSLVRVDDLTSAERDASMALLCIILNTFFAMVFDGRNEYLTDRSVVFDAGEKLGVTLTFTELRGIPSTPEEKAEVRRNLDRVIQQIFPGWRLAPEPGESA